LIAVAVVGLGGMGSRLAARLLAAGHEVIVWNRSPEKMSSLVESGAVPVLTPGDAARAANTLITMVADPLGLRSVTEGPNGVVAGASPELTVVQMSTVGPDATSRLASALRAKKAQLIDAPVLGSLAEAESGSLVIFAGGDPAVVERLEPLLKTLGSVIRVGGIGAASAAKLVANSTFFNALCALGEAVAFADELGLPRATTFEILAATPFAAQAERRRAVVQGGDFPARFQLALACKDARLIHEAAEAHAVRLPLSDATRMWLASAFEAGLGDRDYTAVIRQILDNRKATSGLAAQSEIGRWDGLIVDLDGVIWRGGEPIPGAAYAIAALRSKGVRVVFLTNEPRRSTSEVAELLTKLGIGAGRTDVITSAAALARVLSSLEDLPVRVAFVIGPPALRQEIEEAGFRLVPNERADEAAVVVVGGHEGFDYGELRGATAAIHAGARLFAIGRDAVYPTLSGPAPATGAILAAVETAGGVNATVIGKPERAIFDFARQTLAGCERIAVVGDNIIGDIQGAQRLGIGTILVLTGNTTAADLEHTHVAPDLVLNSIAELPAAYR
jgi:3-hydroxyisobutyrate dehydrogenase